MEFGFKSLRMKAIGFVAATLAWLAIGTSAHVDAATRTTTQAGNVSSGSTWVGGVAPSNGDILIINHAVTFDQNLIVGDSPHSTLQSRPTVAATGSGGSLPAGAYRVKLVAVSAYGETTGSASSLQATITAGQVVRITVPALVPGATSYNAYLSQASGAAGSERRYATGLSPGTFDCSSASWMDGTTTYAAATALPAATEAIQATAKITIPNGVKVTAKGAITYTADIQIDSTTTESGIEFDATSSPGSGAAVYRLLAGTTSTQGTGTIISTWTGSARPFIRSKAGTTPASIEVSSQTSTSGNIRLNLNGMRFSNLGGASRPAVNAFCNVASLNHQLTDVVFDADCRELAFSGQPATSGWILNRVAFRQTDGNTYGSRTCSVAFQFANSADVTTGTRSVTDCAFEVLPPALSAGGSTYTRCYFNDTYAQLPSGVGGTANSNLTITDSFWRKTYVLDTRDVGGNTAGNYLYFDNVTGTPSTDLNPHGIGCPANGVGTTRTHQTWVVEYNGSDDSGDVFKSPGVAAGTVELLNNLIIPNAAGKSSGTIYTFPNNPNSGYRLRCDHNTYIAGPYSLATSEGGAQPASTISSFRSNLAYNIIGTASGRYAIGKSDGNGATDTLDVVLAADADYNAGWNLLSNGNAGTWYNIRCTGTPGAHDVDLGDSAGADVATNGPRFVDPTRNFKTWAVAALGASGTDSQKIATGLDALKAIADPTSSNHVPGLVMTAPWTWVRDGFKVRNASLRNAGHDGVTIGAMEYQPSFRPFWIPRPRP